MDDRKQTEFVQRARTISQIPEQDRRYYQEQLIHDYLRAVEKETLPLVVALADWCFTGWAKDLIENALRENAIWPDRCVEADEVTKVLQKVSDYDE